MHLTDIYSVCMHLLQNATVSTNIFSTLCNTFSTIIIHKKTTVLILINNAFYSFATVLFAHLMIKILHFNSDAVPKFSNRKIGRDAEMNYIVK